MVAPYRSLAVPTVSIIVVNIAYQKYICILQNYQKYKRILQNQKYICILQNQVVIFPVHTPVITSVNTSDITLVKTTIKNPVNTPI